MEPKEKSSDISLAPELMQRLTPATDSPLPKTRQFYRALYDAVMDGSLPKGTRLPASRHMANKLGLARNIVVYVYQQLNDENLLISDGRRGTRVLHQTLLQSKTPSKSWPLSKRSSLTCDRHPSGPALAPGEPDASLFPKAAWKQALLRASQLSAKELAYQEQSLPRLQAAISRYLATYRSMPVKPEQVLVTSGTRQSLLLWASLFADPGETCLMESPGYLGAYEAGKQLGLNLQACTVDKNGLRLPADTTGAKLLYTTPCFQYPTGVPLSTQRREALLQWSQSSGAVIFEDDYDSEFRDNSQPMPALAAQAVRTPDARVVHAGTFSKLIFPAARVGWMILPESCMPTAARLLKALGGGHNTIAQAVVAELLDNGAVSRHLQRARQVYTHRRNAIIQALSTCRNLSIEGKHHGSLSLVVHLRQATPVKALDKALQARQLGALPMERLHWERSTQQKQCHDLVIGLGNTDSLSLPTRIQSLDEAVAEAMASA